MKEDITNRTDIKLLVNTFYDKVKNHAELSHFFINVNWKNHLNAMYGFWENIIFQTGEYNGNPMTIHEEIGKKIALKKIHFKKYIELFIQTVDELFAGENAKLAKQRAIGITRILQSKIVEKK